MKCTFMQPELVYLGFLISKEGLKMDPEKVKAISTRQHLDAHSM